MRNAVSFFLVSIFCLFGAAATSAQFMTPHYIVAFTQSKDSSGTIGTITVTISGYATVVNGVPPSVRHTPSAFLTIDGIGGRVYGTAVCPSCNVYATQSVTKAFDSLTDSCFLSGLDPTLGCFTDVQTNGLLQCTQAGNLFSGGSNGYHAIEVLFSGTPVVPLGADGTITATVNNNSANLPITLTLATQAGTSGQALFDNSQTTKSITATTLLSIFGAQLSSAPNNIILTARVTVDSTTTIIGITSFKVDVTNGAIPVNFRQTSASQVNPTALRFVYTWGSSTSNLNDLGSCRVREFVTYPGYTAGLQQNYWWTSPPYVKTYSPNPETTTPVAATGGTAGITDLQKYVGFAQPYQKDTAPSQQVFQFQCAYYQSNQWIQFYPYNGNISIVRTVDQNAGGAWQYTVSKSGISNTGLLP